MRHHLKWTLISLLFLSSPYLKASQPPVTTDIKPAIDANVFYKKKDWEHVFKYRWAPDAEENFQKLSFSSRFEMKNLYKVGVYFARTFGERHFPDWKKIDGQFQWRELDGETESHLGAMAQKKWPLTDKLGAELRVQVERHLDHEMNFLRFRPGLTWLATPQWTTYIKYEAYKLIDSDVSTFYRTGVYLGGLYRGFSQILVGPFLKYKRQEWWTSPDFKKEFGHKYRSHEHNYSLGVSFIYYL